MGSESGVSEIGMSDQRSEQASTNPREAGGTFWWSLIQTLSADSDFGQ